MVVAVKITSKGQITLPKEFRKILNVHAGNVVVFEKVDDTVVIKAARTLKEFKGCLKGKAKAVNFEEMRKKVKKHIGKKVAQRGKY
ncbi:MAG: AbrB/MazE/SpoVT family DNA-binding domain-containing protein [Planctomycetes bacterium]|nr:AbrB/MazE/SpoVT family DNA-binding domain-containing protein [Planctomycetota bacterium]